MSDPAKKHPLYADLQRYAAGMDATLSVLHFVTWLRENRPDLQDLSDSELQALAYECVCEFAYEASA